MIDPRSTRDFYLNLAGFYATLSTDHARRMYAKYMAKAERLRAVEQAHG